MSSEEYVRNLRASLAVNEADIKRLQSMSKAERFSTHEQEIDRIRRQNQWIKKELEACGVSV